MIKIEGKCGIKATVLADSINSAGNRLTTFEIEYPRLILAEVNTHRMLSKNSFSSRAVPFNKMLQQLQGRPVRFGQANAGMQDKGVDYNAPIVMGGSVTIGDDVYTNTYTNTVEEWWEENKRIASYRAELAYEAGYHKQVYNRPLEPYQMMKTVVSATEFDNFFWLRDHEAADPSFAELARVMREAREQSVPELLKAGEWHLPYILTTREDNEYQRQEFWLENEDGVCLTTKGAIKVSCARCAAVSYRNEGYGLEKSLEVYDRLVGDQRKHASAFEHCATPMQESAVHYSWGDIDYDKSVNVLDISNTWEDGVTHVDKNDELWSGNFKGWIQYRKLIPGENYTGEIE